MTANNSSLPGAAPGDGLVSVREAARMLHVSPSTVWRWVSRRIVPAYRIGPKRVWLKTADLEALITPARVAATEMPPLHTTPRAGGRPSAAEIARGLAAVEAARAFQDELLAKRGGKLFRNASELLHEARTERTRQLP